MDKSIITALQEAVGKDQVSLELIDLVAYATDASEFRHRPEVVVLPGDTAQVAAVMELASREMIPVTPRGAGTGLSGGAVPLRGGILLDLSRMDRIVKISLEDRLAVVQPGVVYAELERQLAPLGFSFPPDPSSGKVSTIGGNVATNAGGIKGAKYGVTKNYVLGLEVVLANGRVMRTGSHTIKSVSGFDLTSLFVGSEGMLGVITEIVLHIVPRPPYTRTALATFDTLSQAGRAVGAVMRAPVSPSVLEIVDHSYIQAINQNTDLALPDVEAILLVETDGFSAAEAETQMERIVEIFQQSQASSVRQAASPEEAVALWAARKTAYSVITRLYNTVIPEDTTVPISKVADMLLAVEEVGRNYDMVLPTVGHLGDGNVHPHFCFDRTDPAMMAKVEQAKHELHQRAVDLGGTLSGEHGIGIGKAPFMEMEHSGFAMGMMRAIKDAFDPHNILNPGKMGLEVKDD
ncbi:MAG: FAD-binding protein [Deltaproteobacteria bacterium]|nr:FAD-binding protein [Deltaproteobacteria bacterium]